MIEEDSFKNLHYAVVDVEVGSNNAVYDIGALRFDAAVFHRNSKKDLLHFLDGIDYVCGHNIIHHDAKYLFGNSQPDFSLVDTLYMSPLLFPERPYHRLVKDDKLMSDQMNNPVIDCEKARDLLYDEITCWETLPETKRSILTSLLKDMPEFAGFLRMVGAESDDSHLKELIRSYFDGRICLHADLEMLISQYPCELAYALVLVDTTDHRSVTPGWVSCRYPKVEYVIDLLRHTPCSEGCPYCNGMLDVHRALKKFFGYDEFRKFEGENLQEMAVRSAVDQESLLAIFPTGGGKSLTFQLPALMEGQSVHGLTVVISPLQSLMKDQVDNLSDRGIADAVTINGLLDPISRALAIERVKSGEASLLYIAPEMLRSKTIERILLSRHVVRFVIDEAHCFSSWGHDFRVDYFYIGKFIRKYQEKKQLGRSIPVSCFTATAKQKVIQDICDYFKTTLGLELQLFASAASRTNLRYHVLHTESDEDKYTRLRALVSAMDCPTIVYVSRTRRTRELASKLTRDGYKALPFNGKMDPDEKIANQDAFMNDEVRIIVATSAFGMGVDKKDVGLVVHYDISDSLENYVQEAGRAGRDPRLDASCYVLFGEGDLDKHFILLNQTKLSLSEIHQVWMAVKALTKQRKRLCCSALEIARQAGWDSMMNDVETRVRTALAALEQGGYLERNSNVPHVYATGITVRNVEEARKRITASALFDSKDVEKAVRVIKSLISQKYTYKNRDAEAESRVDYLADILGMTKGEVVSVVERMRQEGILADSKDITAFLMDGDTERKSRMLLGRFSKLERYILSLVPDGTLRISSKQLNENALRANITTSKEKDIFTLIYFLTVKGYIRKKEDASHNMEIGLQTDRVSTMARMEKRFIISAFVLEWLYRQQGEQTRENEPANMVKFSVVALLNAWKKQNKTLFDNFEDVQLEEVEEALLYLSKIGALRLEGGFLVLYNAMDIRRLKDNPRYIKDDYRMLDEFYKHKMQQVHIVGEYANLMVRDYDAALQYVGDYFQMDFKKFIAKYFKGEKAREINRNLTPKKYQQLFGKLSPRQLEIITDKDSNRIVVAACPGSGKTLVLVHKLASLLLQEDVKKEQLLMLTFSRSAASEFKLRLRELIGNAVNYVEIKTFHSYCFDLLGRVGNLEDANDVVPRAAAMIEQGEVEPNRIGKTVLVIDEAQDMSDGEFALVRALTSHNKDLRVVAVGDDDQNIYDFRGANSWLMFELTKDEKGKFYEMTDNFRSSRHVVDFANAFTRYLGRRLKSTPIHAVRQEEGYVEVTRHLSNVMYQPLVDNLVKCQGRGSVGVLTQTNEEAVILVALLRRHGVNSKLVQSLDGFRFCNLAEMRYLLRYLEKKATSPLISDELWEEAKNATFAKYKTSDSIVYVKNCVKQFEQLNPMKYSGDFWDFVFESSVEDFCDTSGADVIVSTIHKAKGREFDDVFMLISDSYQRDDSLMRRFYVGITRAKNRLFIHTSGNFFDRLPADRNSIDQNHYSLPDEIVLQLSHKDLYLDFFLNRKREVLALNSGDILTYRDEMFFTPSSTVAVAKISASMRDAITDWLSKGYQVKSAKVRFVVAWKPADSSKGSPEYAVMLPDLVLQREHDSQD